MIWYERVVPCDEGARQVEVVGVKDRLLRKLGTLCIINLLREPTSSSTTNYSFEIFTSASESRLEYTSNPHEKK